MALAPFSSVRELLAALRSIEGMPSDDVVAALPHLLQTAERLDADHGNDSELVAAGLVHDLASALEIGCPDHAAAGAALVAPLLGARVAELVDGHTDAKRYLVTVEPDYAVGLSANSTFTLIGQGGAMHVDEVATFAARREVAALVALRRADDGAKVPGAPTRPVEAWQPLLDRVATTARPLPRN
jgi:predicted HD phosphohydrolase